MADKNQFAAKGESSADSVWHSSPADGTHRSLPTSRGNMPCLDRKSQEDQQSTSAVEQTTSTIERKPSKWVTVIHNDPVNLMTYVQWIFETYFNMDPNVARMKMMQVHYEGRAIVARGGREQMERDAQAMHTYGLWATIEPEVADK